MAQYLSHVESGVLKPTFASIAVMCLFVAMPVTAETLVDPTLPPSFVQGQDGMALSGPVLQSVMLGSKRKAALISGQLVPVGGKYGDAVLVRVSDHSAELRNPDKTTQTLFMYAAVKKMSAQKPTGKTTSSKNKQSGVEQTQNLR